MNEKIFNSERIAWLARRDGTVVVGYGPFRSHPTPPVDGVAFFVNDYRLSRATPWCVPERHEVIEAAEFASIIPVRLAPRVAWQTPEASDFATTFQEVLMAIQAGEFEKTVPVVTERGVANDAPARWIAGSMSKQRLPLHSYGWLNGEVGFAGATPELLFCLRGDELVTMALAGTARSEDSDAFSADEKEIREHEFVAQTLIEKLSRLGEVMRVPRETLHLGPIVHFHSAIRVRLRDGVGADELISLLHPTPALGPLPRTPATLERLYRWRDGMGAPAEFGAPFGVWHQGSFEAVVAIRAIWWNRCEIRLPAGCGVIEASRLVNEWRELRLKREAVRRFLLI